MSLARKNCQGQISCISPLTGKTRLMRREGKSPQYRTESGTIPYSSCPRSKQTYIRSIHRIVPTSASSQRWAQEGIRDGLTTELRSGGGCCEFYRDNALVLSLSAPYVVGNNGVLTVQDQIKADICRIQRKVNLQGAPLTHRELWHLSDDLAAYYAERDQRNLKKSQAKHRSDRYVALCQRTEKKKRALISAMIRDGSTEPWDADKIAAKVYVPFMEELYASFPSLVAGATLFERTQMLELLEAYRKPGLPFDGYWQLPPEAQVFTTKGGLYDVV